MDIVVEQMFKFGSAPATNAVPDVSVAVASFTAMQYARRCLRQGELGGLHKKSIQEKTTELLAARKSQMDYRKANGYGNKVTPSPDVAKTLVELNNKVNKLELERADLVAKYREATKNFDFCALAAREKFLDTLF